MPNLIAMRGAPGTGKSTIARALSRHRRWPVVDKDDIKDVLDNLMEAAGGPSYDVMARLVRRQLLLGLDVICDSPLPGQTYENLVNVAEETGATLIVLECRCPDEAVWRTRVEQRQSLSLPAHHTTTWGAVKACRARHAGTDDAVTGPHLVIDTSRPVAGLVIDVSRWLTQLES
ncbi:MAG: ATP-binding protein [Chloroflexia bacterium]|nr:ATP-binding protein [Chloroflexia bacterium]